MRILRKCKLDCSIFTENSSEPCKAPSLSGLQSPKLVEPVRWHSKRDLGRLDWEVLNSLSVFCQTVITTRVELLVEVSYIRSVWLMKWFNLNDWSEMRFLIEVGWALMESFRPTNLFHWRWFINLIQVTASINTVNRPNSVEHRLFNIESL